MSRFDYIEYDKRSEHQQAVFKKMAQTFEEAIESQLLSPRAKALALTKLEECYCWIGKAIRDDQVQRGTATLQEKRKDG